MNKAEAQERLAFMAETMGNIRAHVEEALEGHITVQDALIEIDAELEYAAEHLNNEEWKSG